MLKVWGRFLIATSTVFLAQAAFAQDACPVTDLNGDGATDDADVAVLHEALGSSEGDSDFVAAADLNGDGQVSTVDYAVMLDCN